MKKSIQTKKTKQRVKFQKTEQILQRQTLQQIKPLLKSRKS